MEREGEIFHPQMDAMTKAGLGQRPKAGIRNFLQVSKHFDHLPSFTAFSQAVIKEPGGKWISLGMNQDLYGMLMSTMVALPTVPQC